MNIIKHGVYWIIQRNNYTCPDCEASSNVIKVNITSGFPDFADYPNIKLHTASFECERCGCKWEISRKEEK
jgi:hypothetical protein